MEQCPDAPQPWVGRALRGWRTQAGLSLDDAAARLGWPGSKLDRYENGLAFAGPVEINALAAALFVHDDERDRTVRRAFPNGRAAADRSRE